MKFHDWRYVLVDRIDTILHWVIPFDIPFLCNLERKMYWDRMNRPGRCGWCDEGHADAPGPGVCREE